MAIRAPQTSAVKAVQAGGEARADTNPSISSQSAHRRCNKAPHVDAPQERRHGRIVPTRVSSASHNDPVQNLNRIGSWLASAYLCIYEDAVLRYIIFRMQATITHLASKKPYARGGPLSVGRIQTWGSPMGTYQYSEARSSEHSLSTGHIGCICIPK